MRFLWMTVLLMPCFASKAAPVPPIYTYQGELRENGIPKNGSVDLIFRVFDSPQGGAEMEAITVGNIAVNDGLFTVLLPLDTSLFHAGGAWWLAAEVREGAYSGTEPYEPLSPRQPITSVPYATNADAVNGVRASALGSAYKKSSFAATPLIPTPGSTELAGITVTAPGSGNLIFRARGSCNITGSFFGPQEITLRIGSSLSEASATPPSGWGVVRLPQLAGGDLPTGRLSAGFFAERVEPILEGASVTQKLIAIDGGGENPSTCIGTLTAEFVPGTL
jgi:hypothetical protein